MTISEVREKCKSLVTKVPRDALILAVLVLASSLSFGLGYLAGVDSGRTGVLDIEQSQTQPVGTESIGVVASKSGTKYYLPSCTGADRISEANKVWFVSASAARAAGYTPAANCEGI